jgi:3-oxoacyl-[acyl-carrier protein] reductase
MHCKVIFFGQKIKISGVFLTFAHTPSTAHNAIKRHFSPTKKIVMRLLENKIALVTGGSRGIGEAIVRKFAQEGAHVAFTYHSSAERAEAVAESIRALGVKAVAYRSDAGSFTESEQLVQAVLAEFGGLDVLVNNAGVTRDKLLLRMGEEDWDAVMQNNLKSVFNLTKHATRHFLKARNGSIINLTSVVGITGNAGQANYAASKAGIIGFTKSVAQELGSRNVRSNALAPGFIETEMTAELPEDVRAKYLENIPLQRLGRGEEIANACLFLASDLSSYVNGQVLSVCGGLHT